MITTKIAALKTALESAENRLAVAYRQKGPSSALLASLTQEVAQLRADLMQARRARFDNPARRV